MRTVFKGQNLRRTYLQIWRNVNFPESAYPSLEPLEKVRHMIIRDLMMRETVIAVEPDGQSSEFSDVKTTALNSCK